MESMGSEETVVDYPLPNGASSSLLNLDVEVIEATQESNQMCIKIESCFKKCTAPCLVASHPLPQKPTLCRRLLDNFLCPPHSQMGAIIFVVCISVSAWTALYSLTDEEALPGGNLFSLLILFVACWCGGYLVKLVRLPPLLGMLLVGGLLGNVPYINIANDIYPAWSTTCRQIALTIILTRAGLGLDPRALRRLSFVVIRLAFLPCLTETIVDGIACHVILGFPWPWGFMLGFVVAAVSPAVVVPSLLGLAEKGYGIDKGIPTLVIAAASLDDVLAITGFGVLLGVSFSTGNIVWTLFKGPLEALAGILSGVIGGVLLWYIPRNQDNLLFFRTAFLMSMGLMCIFGSIRLHWAGSGPLAVLTMSFVAALRWRFELVEGTEMPINDIIGVLWMMFQPLLFGLIGCEVDVSSLGINIVGLGIAVLCIGLSFRMLVSFLAVFRTDLNYKERFFISIAWLPKATVQAAIGAVALDAALNSNDDSLVDLGTQVLNLAVLSIILTAPLGSLLIGVLGPILLKRSLTYENSSVIIPEGDEEAAMKMVHSDREVIKTKSYVQMGNISIHQ